ncbi:MAG: ABC transporter permease [bacterium]|nr:ABC transporter permease [bacterium]
MIFGALLRISYDALRANKLRSGLTLLGVVIGVTSVMTIVSALEGMQGAIAEDLNRLGPATFVVTRMGVVTSEEMFWEKIKRKPLTLKNVTQIEEGCEYCDKVSPRGYYEARVKYRDQALRNVLIGGATANYVDIVDIEVAMGRFHSFEDDLYNRKVAYIGEQIRKDLFEGIDPLGKEISIGGKKFTVIGVAKELGSSFGNNQDNFIMIPFSVFETMFGQQRRGLNFAIKAVDVAHLKEAMDQTRMVLRSARHVPFDAEDDFDMLTADNILDMLNEFTKVIRWGLIGISSISLVVGGIVVMNIMMVSVTERTREIGIRKSLGAKRNHILVQFVFESLLVTLTGGLIGIIAGFLIARSLVGLMDMEIQPSALAIFLGLGISVGVGLFFGIYPAMKAARLDPVKALSYE